MEVDFGKCMGSVIRAQLWAQRAHTAGCVKRTARMKTMLGCLAREAGAAAPPRVAEAGASVPRRKMTSAVGAMVRALQLIRGRWVDASSARVCACPGAY